MSQYPIEEIRLTDPRGLAAADALLAREGIRRDAHLDYLCGMYDDTGELIGTGGCFGETLRCFAVSGEHQGEGLLNEIITHLVQVQASRGRTHLYLYTKEQTGKFFRDLGFYEIARVSGTLVFMENRRRGFEDYLARLRKETESAMAGMEPPAGRGTAAGRIGAVVMNANPFTLGHQYLAETAAADCDLLHLFLLSEDASLVPYKIRRRLAEAGTAHLPNVILHDSGPYIISSATFPSYFLKEENAVIEGHARLDLAVFARIAQALGITDRYVGEEPFSRVTGIYNQLMTEQLPAAGIRCHVIPRKVIGEKGQDLPEGSGIISASAVREALKTGDRKTLQAMLPESSLAYFDSPEAAAVLERIRGAGETAHY